MTLVKLIMLACDNMISYLHLCGPSVFWEHEMFDDQGKCHWKRPVPPRSIRLGSLSISISISLYDDDDDDGVVLEGDKLLVGLEDCDPWPLSCYHACSKMHVVSIVSRGIDSLK